MKFPTQLHYSCKCCTPTWVLILAVNGVQDIWICVNVVDNKKLIMNCTDILNNDEKSFGRWRHLLTTCWNSYPINSKISQQWVSFLFVYWITNWFESSHFIFSCEIIYCCDKLICRPLFAANGAFFGWKCLFLWHVGAFSAKYDICKREIHC